MSITEPRLRRIIKEEIEDLAGGMEFADKSTEELQVMFETAVRYATQARQRALIADQVSWMRGAAGVDWLAAGVYAGLAKQIAEKLGDEYNVRRYRANEIRWRGWAAERGSSV
jgi:hypothetical protein